MEKPDGRTAVRLSPFFSAAVWNSNMTTAYLALGSNLGNRQGYLDAAVRRLRAEPGVQIVAVSPYYETEAVGGPPDQQKFLNAVVAIETQLAPQALLRLLLEIEHRFGRVRTVRNAPRTLDLDLLLYGDQIWDEPELTIPHPRMHERAFVLVPLADLAPDVVHPVLRMSVRELLIHLPESDRASVSLPRPTPLDDPRTFARTRVLVTGSTSGIGRAIASEFAARGADVIVHGRSREVAETVASQLRAHGGDCRAVRADLREQSEVDRLATEAWDVLGDGLGVLVCNAGADVLTGDAARMSFEQKLDELLAVDLKATIRLSRLIGERMKAAGRGVILTVGWDQAETGMEGDSGQLFGAAKGAVVCFTRSLALSLAPEVRVNCLAPGWIRTLWGETASEMWQERVRRETPQRIWGLPEDVAAAACWLASPAAAFVTGQTIRINGGAVR
jgi:3-oxoacyl-[acyl-carrier protein] reductase